MDKMTAILCYLRKYHTGRGRAVHSCELERLFSLTGRSLRRRIFALRQEGYPVCADENGYYYAEKQSEINDTVGRLDELVTKISNSRTGLLHAMLTAESVSVDIRITLS
ncbi:MAG: hypothetical protein IJM44_08335 [Ruminococcus sp.]|nr:hypothetical protein [Ruminococcus sp.]